MNELIMQPLTTVEEAKKHLDNHMEKGANCPVCNQLVKIYFRSLNGNMAYALFLMYKFTRETPDEFIHFENELKKRNIPSSSCADFPKLRFWNLLEQKNDTKKEDGNPRLGYYKLTAKGRSFVNGLINVQHYVKLFNNQFYGYEGDFVSFRECLTLKFNYDELMKGIADG